MNHHNNKGKKSKLKPLLFSEVPIFVLIRAQVHHYDFACYYSGSIEWLIQGNYKNKAHNRNICPH